jgi:hypothetical protein
MKTWKIEISVVAFILLVINFFTHKLFSIELLSSFAVIFSFGHAQIASRLAEQESLKSIPNIKCYYKLIYFFIAKEILWFIYFLFNHCYSALIGVIIFLIYPFWRKMWLTKWKHLFV